MRVLPGRIAGGIVCLAGAVAGWGCSAALPRYGLAEPEESLAIIADRMRAVHAFSGAAIVELGASESEVVQLDAALVAEPPDRLRLRAWKLDHVVFDATLREGALWLLPDSPAGSPMNPQAVATGLRRALLLLAPSYYESAAADPDRTNARELVVIGDAGGAGVICQIDRSSLTPRHFSRASGDPENSLSITLTDYQMIDSIAWPHTWIIAHSGGRVIVKMRDVEINGELPPGAFDPPRRAVRSP
jgi:hypothetical protein